jgi:hypothetical protein
MKMDNVITEVMYTAFIDRQIVKQYISNQANYQIYTLIILGVF